LLRYLVCQVLQLSAASKPTVTTSLVSLSTHLSTVMCLFTAMALESSVSLRSEQRGHVHKERPSHKASPLLLLSPHVLRIRRVGYCRTAAAVRGAQARRRLWSCALLTHRELSFVFSRGASLPPFLPNQVTLQLHFRCSDELRTLSETFHSYVLYRRLN